MQTFIHYFSHFGVPLLIAFVFFRKEWGKVYLILIATMLVDLDHLLADPIFQANRCSIGFHPLHTYPAMAVYFLMIFLRRPFVIIGMGLLLHMFTDSIDCLMMFNSCKSCFADSPAVELMSYIFKLMGME